MDLFRRYWQSDAVRLCKQIFHEMLHGFFQEVGNGDIGIVPVDYFGRFFPEWKRPVEDRWWIQRAEWSERYFEEMRRSTVSEIILGTDHSGSWSLFWRNFRVQISGPVTSHEMMMDSWDILLTSLSISGLANISVIRIPRRDSIIRNPHIFLKN